METPDVLVIGAGLIGCSLARELARAGQRVVVVDRGPADGNASPAAAGLLTPGLSASAPGPFLDLCHQSAALYESWVAELRAEGAGDVGFRRQGLLEVWTDPAQVDREYPALTERRNGRPWQRLSGADVLSREPALAPGVLGGVYYPNDAQVDPARLTHEVARLAEAAGVRFRHGELVHRLDRRGDRVAGVHTGQGDYHPGTLVLAAGAWSGELLRMVGLDLPVRPVKGQMVLAVCRTSPVHSVVFADDALLVPRPDGTLLLGVTIEEAGFDSRVTLDGVRTILEGACRVVPSVGRLALGRAWAGLRPGTADEWPFMGPVPPLRNLWVSTGHFRKGILLAPVCARLMARSILNGRLDDGLTPFQPARCLGSP